LGRDTNQAEGKEKDIFFEKKKQKTFDFLVGVGGHPVDTPSASTRAATTTCMKKDK
jgi:hypothetical protein